MNHNEIPPEWRCGSCTETVEGNFEVCWNCGTSNTGQQDLDFVPDNRMITDDQKDAAEWKYSRETIFLAGIICFLLIIISRALASITPYTNEMMALCMILCLAGIIGLIFGVIIPTYDPKNKHIPGRQEKLRRDLSLNWAICPNCFTANLPIVHLCLCCTTPLTTHAEIDPIARIHATGDTYRKACNRPYKFIIFLGTWVIFGHLLPFNLISLIDLFKTLLNIHPVTHTWGSYPTFSANPENTLSNVFSILVTLFQVTVYSIILYKVTKNYFRLRKQPQPI